MLLFFSDSQIFDLVRNAENKPISNEEISVRSDYYMGRVRERAAATGIVFCGEWGTVDTISVFSTELRGNPNSIQTGLNLLDPIAITIQLQDLNVLIENPMTRSAMQKAWAEFEPQFTKIGPQDIRGQIETAARKFFGSVQEYRDPEAAEKSYRAAMEEMKRLGIADPAAKYEEQRKFDEAEIAKELARIRREQEAVYEAWDHPKQQPSEWHVELPE